MKNFSVALIVVAGVIGVPSLVHYSLTGNVPFCRPTPACHCTNSCACPADCACKPGAKCSTYCYCDCGKAKACPAGCCK